MKSFHMIVGFMLGAAVGGTVVASTGAPSVAGGSVGNEEAVKKIVRDVIASEPKLIIESVQKFQQSEQLKAQQSSSESLKDAATRDAVFSPKDGGSIGPKDSKKVVAEFFDYNCPACKMQLRIFKDLLAKDPGVRIVFHEFPIFGPTSDYNAKIGLAVSRLYPDRYFDFYAAMMEHEGRTEAKDVSVILKKLGFDEAKIKKEMALPEVDAALEASRKLGEKLNVRGTPTLAAGDAVIPHVASAEELLQAIGGAGASPAAAPEAPPAAAH